MIATLVCASLFAGPTILETSDLSEDRIVFQAIAKISELDDRELGRAKILAEILTAETEDFGTTTLRRFSSQAGQPMRCTVMGDHLRLQLVVPKGQLSNGVSLFDSVLRRATLSQDSIDAALKWVPYRNRSYWSEALDPWVADYSRVRREDLVALYRRAFTPGGVTISVMGAFAPGSARAALSARLDGWQPVRTLPYRPGRPAKPLANRKVAVTTLNFVGPGFMAEEPALSQSLLAVIALGTGKDSSAFRVVRDGMGVSYRQEGVVWPSAAGFTPNLVFAILPVDDALGVGESIRSKLLEDIARWDFAVLERAKGMAEGVLSNGVPLSPLYLSGSVPLGDSLEDRCFLDAYWRSKTGRTFDSGRLVESLRQVSLDGLQATARTFVEAALIRVIEGSR